MNTARPIAERLSQAEAARLPVLIGAFVSCVVAVLTGMDTRMGVAFALGFIGLVILFVRAEWMLYGILAFIVAFVDGWAPTRSPEDVAFRLGIGRVYIMEIAVYALLGAYAIKRFLGAEKRDGSFFAPTPLDRPLWFFVALLPTCALYGLLRGNPLQDALGYFEWRSLFAAIIFYFLLVSLLNKPAQAMKLFWWFLALVTVKAFYFLLLYFFDAGAPVPLLLGAGPVDEGPENVMFVFAGLAAVSLCLFPTRKDWRLRTFLWVAVAAILANSVLSAKRSTQLALVVGLIVLTWALPLRQKIKWGSLATVGILAVLLLAAAAGSTSWKRGLESVGSRYDEIIDFVQNPEQLSLTGGTLPFHILDLLDAWEEIKQRPLLGFGFGSKYERRYTLLPNVGGELADLDAGMVHSLYLHLWWKMGLPGLIAFLWVIGRFLRIAHKAVPKVPSTFEGEIAKGFYAAIWGDLAMEAWGPQWFSSTKDAFLIFLGIALVVRLCQASDGIQPMQMRSATRGQV